ncbi:MAG: twin-arginine translocase TatA/TatE family subunit [Armatimonadetes bacterium]|nr:twin-arginine translocase TatA/TatE family subunit [Armatimonadota bacterium]
MGSIGVPELIIIMVVALVVFGPKKLPEIGKSLGTAMREFRRASSDLMNTFEDMGKEDLPAKKDSSDYKP